MWRARRQPRPECLYCSRNDTMKSSTEKHYDPVEIVDAPEYYQYSQAFGILTCGSWDHRVRSFEDRVHEFMCSFPPEDPVRNSPGGNLLHNMKGGFVAGSGSSRRARFGAGDWKTGSFYELLARYGLKARGSPTRPPSTFEPGSSREAAKRRNVKLRVLHGGVDVEPSNMDAAKAAYLDGEESKKAAGEVRAAVKRMQEELREDKGGQSD